MVQQYGTNMGPTWASPYGLAYMGPIWVQYGLAQMGLPRYSPYGTHIGLLAGTATKLHRNPFFQFMRSAVRLHQTGALTIINKHSECILHWRYMCITRIMLHCR